jgi:16S rRNA (cytidine1402-2'-O)-methyltransferase
MTGTLYIVATPIGNLADITLRALDTLKSVDYIACENRERHLKLLSYYQIHKRLFEYSPANEKNSSKGLVQLLLEGKNIALVSDAGVPSVSDPGRVLIQDAILAKVPIVPIPGPSALTSLLSVSGFSQGSVVFLGFLSKSAGKQRKELSLYLEIRALLVIFVSSYQIKKLLEVIYKIFGNAEIIIGREMTKLNEEFIRGRVLEIISQGFLEKGEFTIAFLTRE